MIEVEEKSSIPLDETQYPGDYPIPFDLFVSKKKYKGAGDKGFLKFTDSAGDLVYWVSESSKKSGADDPHRIKLLLDSSDNPLFSICRVSKGSWRGFRGNVEEQNLIFTMNKTKDEFKITEFKILLSGEHNDDSKTTSRMIGCPFTRSSTIYKDDSIVAETSLMYKLGIANAFVTRSRFRVTFFPGSNDPSLVASFIAVYFDGRKLWI